MSDKNQSGADRHLDTPSESNREQHINFPEVEEDRTGSFVNDKNSTERQKQRERGLKDGEDTRQNTDNDSAAMPMDEDDTLGIP